MIVKVTKDGPYIVSSGVPLSRAEIATNEQGESVGWRETERIEARDTYTLCRCGRSRTKPFCDGSHVGHFEGRETAGHGSFMERAVPIDGPGVVLRDARDLCAEARFCDRAGGLWNLVSQCDEPGIRELVEEEAMLCPSGRYVLSDKATEETREPDLERSIVLIEDPAMGVSGPLFVRGRIPIVDSNGKAYEVRNRVTLCRCGTSRNKPFCDGSHLGVGFRDESAQKAVE